MNKGQLYVELVKKKMMNVAIAIIRGKKNKFSTDEVAVILGNKKATVKKVVKEVKESPKESPKEEKKEASSKKKKKSKK